jgi:hypothetical protein
MTAPGDPKNQRERPLLRLWSAVSTMGLPQIRRLHLLELRRCPPWAGCAYQFRAEYYDGCVQGTGD